MRKYFFILPLLYSASALGAVKMTYCEGSTVYTSCNAGYYLSSSTCKPCAIGTYKSSSGTDTSCTTCPSSGGVAGTTASTATKDITGCCIPAGQMSWTDSAGTYTCGQDSCYVQ